MDKNGGEKVRGVLQSDVGAERLSATKGSRKRSVGRSIAERWMDGRR